VSLGEEACVVAELCHEGKQLLTDGATLRATSHVGATGSVTLADGFTAARDELAEPALEPLDDAALSRLDALAQSLYPGHVSRSAQLALCLPQFHDFHEEIRICRGLDSLADDNPVSRQQDLGAFHRVLQQTRRLVHFDGFAQSLPTLGRPPSDVAIGVQRTTKLTLALGELG